MINEIADELQKLAALRDNGVLTEDEFRAVKAKILGLDNRQCEGTKTIDLDPSVAIQVAQDRMPVQPLRGPLPQKAPAWMGSAGTFLVVLSLVTSGLIALVGGGGSIAGMVVAGLLNPLMWVCLPLGLYWVNEAGKSLEAAERA